jgi:hypothetical protein
VRIGKIEVKRRVWVGLACAVTVTAAWWSWTQARPPVAAVAGQAPQPFVRLSGVGTATNDQVLRERADLLDPTPLFFPTEWNYGQRPLRESLRRQPGQVFGSFDPKWTFTDQALKSYGVEAAPAPEKLSDVLGQGNEAPFAGIGHIDVPRTALPDRTGFLEVRRFGGSEPIIGQTLRYLSLPRSDYAPLEFLVLVSSSGIVGDPVLTSGSGWEEVDSFFRTYIVKTFRLGERLNPGRYRVLVGP